MKDKTKWFADCGWGVMCHWLGALPSTDGGADLTADVWRHRVDAFDVEGLGRQLEGIGAPYFLITIGQNSGHFIAPNETYDRYVGIRPSKCSRRDIVAELYDDLHARGIELLVYLPSGAPAADPMAVQRLEWEWGFKGEWPEYWGPARTGRRLAAFPGRTRRGLYETRLGQRRGGDMGCADRRKRPDTSSVRGPIDDDWQGHAVKLPGRMTSSEAVDTPGRMAPSPTHHRPDE